MSKIGKKTIDLPANVQLSLAGSLLTVKGPKGTLSRTIPSDITVTVADSKVTVGLKKEQYSRADSATWGLWRALVNNLIIGVSSGWEETLEFQGVGYKAVIKGQNLELALGYSHPITITAPEGISFTADKTSIKISGIDKELVGQVAANIRLQRLPEPYKGSGIRYSTEIIKRKAGKKAATAA